MMMPDNKDGWPSLLPAARYKTSLARRCLSAFLALALAASGVPVEALADSTDGVGGDTIPMLADTLEHADEIMPDAGGAADDAEPVSTDVQEGAGEGAESADTCPTVTFCLDANIGIGEAARPTDEAVEIEVPSDGSEWSLPEVPFKREGHTFRCWSLTPDGHDVEDDPETTDTDESFRAYGLEDRARLRGTTYLYGREVEEGTQEGAAAEDIDLSYAEVDGTITLYALWDEESVDEPATEKVAEETAEDGDADDDAGHAGVSDDMSDPIPAEGREPDEPEVAEATEADIPDESAGCIIHVTYDPAGGEGSATPRDFGEGEDAALSRGSHLTRDGYTLIGWEARIGRDDGTYEALWFGLSAPVRGLALEYRTPSASWQAETQVVDLRTIAEDGGVVLFARWRKDATGEVEQQPGLAHGNPAPTLKDALSDARSDAPAEGTHADGRSFSIRLVSNGAGEEDVVLATGGARYAPVCPFEYPHWEFLGWGTQADGGGVTWEAGEALPPEGDMVLYAQWRKTMPDGIDGLDFTSARLIVGMDSTPEVGEVVSEHDGVYLLQFEDKPDAAWAYTELEGQADFVAPDLVLSVASTGDAAEDFGPYLDGDDGGPETLREAIAEGEAAGEVLDAFPPEQANEEEPYGPITDLSAIGTTEEAEPGAVALIDTGVRASDSHVTDYLSVIGDVLIDTNGHGTSMLDTMAATEPDVRVVSIKALDSQGQGTAASVYAAVEAAIGMRVKVINLSLYAPATEGNAAVEAAIRDAFEAGITVVGAAGNDGKDAKWYVPGRMGEEAVIVGSCDSEGNRTPSSNWGQTVDGYVPSSSTSGAAAKVSAWLGVHGTFGRELELLASPGARTALGLTDRDLTGTDTEAPDDSEFMTAWTNPKVYTNIHFAKDGWISDGNGGYFNDVKYSAAGYEPQEPEILNKGWISLSIGGANCKSMDVYLQAFKLKIVSLGSVANGGITYRAHVQTYGWQNEVSNDALAGTTGESKRLEAFWAKFTGTFANLYSIGYNSTVQIPNQNGQNLGKSDGAQLGNTGVQNKLASTKFFYWKKSFNRIVQVRYQNADGSYGSYSNVINSSYTTGSTVSWSRAQDATYKAASGSWDVAGAATNQITVYRKTATATVQVRYQNADGSYGGYSNATSATKCVGGSVSWSRVQDATYKAASGTATIAAASSATANPANATTQVTVYRKTATATVQVRYQNADGSYGGYSNATSATKCVGGSVSWSRAQDATYQAASGTATIAAASSATANPSNATTQVTVYRRTATNTIQARYQNADGSWGAYSNVSSGTNYVGQVRSWSRAADATYKAASASITGTASNQTKQVSVERQTYNVNVNCLEPRGTETYQEHPHSSMFDLRIDSGAWTQYLYNESGTGAVRYGQKVTIGNIRIRPGFELAGVEGATPNGDGTYSLTVTGAATISIKTRIRQYTTSFDANGGTVSGQGEFTQDFATSVQAPAATRTGYKVRQWVPVKADDTDWVEVMYQSPMAAWFGDAAGARSANGLDLYSTLGQLPQLMRDGVYEFMLTSDEWPGEYNRWRQTSDPASSATIEGFEAVSLSWNASTFSGLGTTNPSSTLISWSGGGWWYAVGGYTAYCGGMPIVSERGNANGVAWKPVHLYVLADAGLEGVGASYSTGYAASATIPVRAETQRFKAQWEPVTYNISYTGMDDPEASFGTHHPNTATYDEALTVSAPTRTGADFLGWRITGMDTNPHVIGDTETSAQSVDTLETTFGNLTATEGATVTFEALWEEHGYTLEHAAGQIAQGRATLPDNLRLGYTEEHTLLPATSDVPGYSFDYWEDEEGTIYHAGDTVSRLCAEDGGTYPLTAHWAVDPTSLFLRTHVTFKNGVLESDLFDFRLMDDSGNVIDTRKNDASGSVRFPVEVTGVEDGATWDYEIRQVPGTRADVSYDATPVHARIVFRDGAFKVYYSSTQGEESDIDWEEDEQGLENELLAYEVVFDSGAGTDATGEMESLTWDRDRLYVMPACAYGRELFDATWWNTEPDGTGVSYYPGESYENLAAAGETTVTLYAQWSAKQMRVSVPTAVRFVVDTEGNAEGPTDGVVALGNAGETCVEVDGIRAEPLGYTFVDGANPLAEDEAELSMELAGERLGYAALDGAERRYAWIDPGESVALDGWRGRFGSLPSCEDTPIGCLHWHFRAARASEK